VDTSGLSSLLVSGCPCDKHCSLRSRCAVEKVACAEFAHWVVVGGEQSPSAHPDATYEIYRGIFSGPDRLMLAT